MRFGELDVLQARGPALRQLRHEAQIVFQDPFGSLDPRMKVRSIVAEGMAHLGLDGARRRERVAELLELVQLTPDAANRFPHEFSGGQRQRISIARALAVNPRLIIADEPVSALDVSVQSQILNLLHDLQEQFSLTYLFISHDMSVVRHVADHVAVMYLGRIVEQGTAAEVFDNPLHPYTQALLSSVPTLSRRGGRKRIVLGGDVPNAIDPPQACRFAGRCPRVIDRCRVELPLLEPASTATPAGLLQLRRAAGGPGCRSSRSSAAQLTASSCAARSCGRGRHGSSSCTTRATTSTAGRRCGRARRRAAGRSWRSTCAATAGRTATGSAARPRSTPPSRWAGPPRPAPPTSRWWPPA